MNDINKLAGGLGFVNNRRRKAGEKSDHDTVAVGFPPGAKSQLVAAADALGFSTAGLLREALQEYLRNHADEINAALTTSVAVEPAPEPAVEPAPVPAVEPAPVPVPVAAPAPAAVPGPPKAAPKK